MPCECKAGTGVLELWGEQGKYPLRHSHMVERKSQVIQECVTHDTVTAAGYAEQCGGAHLP